MTPYARQNTMQAAFIGNSSASLSLLLAYACNATGMHGILQATVTPRGFARNKAHLSNFVVQLPRRDRPTCVRFAAYFSVVSSECLGAQHFEGKRHDCYRQQQGWEYLVF